MNLTENIEVYSLTVKKIFSSEPSCSKYRELNELVKRSTRYVFYDLITKYIQYFCWKMEEVFALLSFSHFFKTKFWQFSDISI